MFGCPRVRLSVNFCGERAPDRKDETHGKKFSETIASELIYKVGQIGKRTHPQYNVN